MPTAMNGVTRFTQLKQQGVGRIRTGCLFRSDQGPQESSATSYAYSGIFFFSVTVMNTHAKHNLEKKGLIWLT